MSAKALDLLAIWIFAPPTAIYLVIALAGAFGFGARIKPTQRDRQLKAFKQFLATNRGSTLDVDWMRFKTIPKRELLDLAALYGWHHTGGDYGGKSWWLRFDHRPAEVTDKPRARLIAELVAAEPGADGVYLMDPAPYGALSIVQRDRLIDSIGWRIVRGYAPGALALARIGTTVTHSVAEPVLQDLRPADLRQHPAVVERASRFHLEHGFDPLGSAELDRLRVRNNYWFGKFLLPGWIAGIFWALAAFPLVIGLREEAATAVNVGIGMAVVAAVASCFAWWVRRRRKADIGAHVAVLRELKALHRS